MSTSKILLRKCIHEVTSIITIDCLIIIQILSKTPCAKWEVLKTKNARGARGGCICSTVCHKHHLLNVSLKRKTDDVSIIIRRMATGKRARAVGIPLEGTGNVTNPGLLPTNGAVYDKPIQIASRFGRRHSTIGGICRRVTLSIRIAVSKPTALALSIVVIRRIMVEMVSVFLFNETFSKWAVRKKLLQRQSLELHVHFAFLCTFHVVRGVLLYTWIIITDFGCYNVCDFMYKFSWEDSVYWCFYPKFKSGQFELLDNTCVSSKTLSEWCRENAYWS